MRSNNQLLPKKPLWLRLSLLTLFVIGGIAVGRFGVHVGHLWWFKPYTEALTRSSLLFAQAVTSVFGLLFAPAIYWHSIEKQPLSVLFRRRKAYGISLLLTTVLVLVFVPVNTWFEQWNAALRLPSFLHDFELWAQQQEMSTNQLIKQMATTDNIGALGIGVIIMAIIPAVGEELLFRGILQRLLYSCFANRDVVIGISAAVFSAIHFQLYAFVPRLLLGMLFGYIYWGTGSLIFPIVAHFFNNALLLLLLYLHQCQYIQQDLTAMAPSLPLWLFFVVCTAIVAVGFYKVESKHNA